MHFLSGNGGRWRAQKKRKRDNERWKKLLLGEEIEANSYNELPEQLIGAVRVSHLELSSAVVPVLEDCEAAEQYCVEIGRRDAYMLLLDMYLDPQDGRAPMLNAIVCLLHNHGEALDPLQVLEALELTTDWFKRALFVDDRVKAMCASTQFS